MSTEPVNTGIDIIGAVPWGTHFCQFYQTREDLLDTLVPYFKAGLENNEFCMWIASDPLSAQQAGQAMQRAMPDFAERLARGQIEVLPHTDWYLKGGSFEQQRVLDGWVDKLNAARAAGYAGLRLTGNTFWLEKRDWKGFTDYEAAINDVIGKYHMLALCTYSMEKCGAIEVMDVIRNHEFALIRREGKWEIIESAVHRQARQTLLENESKYRLLFQNMGEGFALYELLYDEEGQPVDWRVLEMNDAYTRHTGITREKILGRRIGEVYPELLPEFLPRFAQVVATQVPVEFEAYSSPTGRHMHVNTFPAGGRRFASAFDDISGRVGAERRIHLLAETASELLKSNSPQLVVNGLCPKVMAFLDCDAYFNFLVDESAGRLRLNAFAGITDEQARTIEWLDYGVAVCGSVARDACRLVAENILETPDPRTELVKSYGIQAYACHPLIAQDRVLGTLSFGTRTRTHFSDEELSFMKAVADLVAIAMQRKRTENTLRETRDYLDNLLNYANAPIIVWDPELRITKFNRAFQRLTGHGEAEVIGQRLDLLFSRESREESLTHIRQAMAGERWETVEIPILRIDGEVRIVLWNSANVNASDGVTVVATIAQGQDITERKQAEEVLRETRDYLDNLLNYANAPIIVWDPELRITKFNHAFQSLTGYEESEVLGKRLDILFPEETREQSLAHIGRTAAGERWEVVEIPVRRTDGVVRTVLWNSANIRASDGVTTVATIAQGQDITERKQAEGAIQELNDVLRQRAAELETANKGLESFAYSVSHDLRAPLRGIDGFSLALLEDYASKLDDQGKDYLHRVRAASQAMGDLIDDMLELSRVSRADFHRRRVDLSGLAQEIAQGLQDREPKRRVDLTIASGLSAHGDVALLRAALENLLSNAWKFTGKCGRAKIEVGAIRKDDQHVYFVKDNGVGFNMSYAGKLFEPFQRLHPKDEFSGTGVGLATVRRIIDRHGGRIWAEGKVGGGATFYFTLSGNRGENPL